MSDLLYTKSSSPDDTEIKPIPSTVRFSTLMDKHQIPSAISGQQIEIDRYTRHMDKPITGQLLHGTDRNGRVYINLPLKITLSDKRLLWVRQKAFIADADFVVTQTYDYACIIFQRHARHKDSIFCIGKPPYLVKHVFLGDSMRDFTMLDRLLSNETLRFHATKVIAFKCHTDPDDWIDITIDLPTSRNQSPSIESAKESKDLSYIRFSV